MKLADAADHIYLPNFVGRGKNRKKQIDKRNNSKPPSTIPIQLPHLVTNFLFFISRIKMWNFTGVQKVINVLEE